MIIDRSNRAEKQFDYSERERNRSLLNQEDLYPAILKLPTRLRRIKELRLTTHFNRIIFRFCKKSFSCNEYTYTPLGKLFPLNEIE